MQNVLPAARLVMATVSVLELASVLSRLRWRDARREAAWLAALLAAFSARLLVPRDMTGDIILSVAVVSFTTGLLLAVNRRPGAPAWSGAAAVVAVILLVMRATGVPPAALRVVDAVALFLLSVPPFALLVLLYRKTGEPADFFLLALATGWDVAACAEAAGLFQAGVSDWLTAPLLLLIGFMLFEQGYLSPLTTSGYVDRLAAERRLERRTYARLLESRNALVLQDRLIAAGLLALGAAHEFRDVLSSVRLAADHGRAVDGAERKDRCLELVAEHAAAGGASAAEFLERLGREGREEPTRLDVRDLIERLVRIARPAWRGAGITLTVNAGGGLAVSGRRREIEQVLLNLLRNAVDAMEAMEATEASGDGDREIRLSAAERDGLVEIEVSDPAGGVPPARAEKLFSLGGSGTRGTGIGLYLARDLALRNDGALSYRALGRGSCFTLSLPRAPD